LSGAGFSFSTTSEAIDEDSHDSDAGVLFTATKYITPKREKNWSKWVDKLYEYRNEHGDCSITKDTCDDEHLFSWVSKTSCVLQYRLALSTSTLILY
jgi:hypothetical protein